MLYKPCKQYRYKKYDYRQEGLYFITICTKNRIMFFGEIVKVKMQLSEMGKIAKKFWLEIPLHFSFIKLDKFIIMPNHIHGILKIDYQNQIVGTGQCRVGTGQCPVPTINYSIFGNVLPKSISTIIGSFKSITTKTINLNFPQMEFAWQARFYDRIIRNDVELGRIREYILNNPQKWKLEGDDAKNIIF